MKHTVKKRNFLLRLTSMITATLTLVTLLSACSADPSAPRATDTVGTVNGHEVCYDELYFLVNGYLPSVREASAGNTETMGTELDRLFRENVLSSYAILALAEEKGLTYREKDWKDEIDIAIAADVEKYYAGDEDAYEESRDEKGLSDRYLRFQLGTDALYNHLLEVYPEQGLVPTGEAELMQLFREKFIHTYHLVLFNDAKDDPAANLAKITEAHRQLKAGEATMGKLIGRGYSEDFSDPAGHGEYVIRGSVRKEYEEAAFSLGIGGISEVISSMGVNNSNETVSCYYVIQRFELDETYLDEHFLELQDAYYGSVIASDLERMEATLTFVPNELYHALDLTALPKPASASKLPVILICSSIGVLLIAGVVAVIVTKKRYAKKNVAYLAKKRNLK